MSQAEDMTTDPEGGFILQSREVRKPMEEITPMEITSGRESPSKRTYAQMARVPHTSDISDDEVDAKQNTDVTFSTSFFWLFVFLLLFFLNTTSGPSSSYLLCLSLLRIPPFLSLSEVLRLSVTW